MKQGHWVLVVIGLLLIVGLFYWFEWRPSKIKKECVDIAREQTIKATIQICDANSKSYENCLAKQMPDLYKVCLQGKGL